ncbi:alpha-protein kinase 2 isoform X2 [Mustelus asterias]
MFPKMSAELGTESSPRFTSTLKSQKVVENVDAQLSCTVSGNPEPEVTWYKGDKQLAKVHGLPKYEIVKDNKVHILRLYRCTEDDSAVYQVSARNSKGIAICSSFLQVGWVTEAQVRRRMMQKLQERSGGEKTPELDGSIGWGGYCESPKDRLSKTAGAEHGQQPPSGGREAAGQAAESLKGIPSGIASEELLKSSAVTRLPNMVKSHGLEGRGAPRQSFLPQGDPSCSPRMGGSSRAAPPRGEAGSRLKEGAEGQAFPASLTTEDEYYLDLLVCSDVLSEQEESQWQQRLERPCPSVWPERQPPESDQLKVTKALPQRPARSPASTPHTGRSTSPTASSLLPGDMGSLLAKGPEETCPLSPATTQAGVTLPAALPARETAEWVAESGLDLDTEGVRLTQVGWEKGCCQELSVQKGQQGAVSKVPGDLCDSPPVTHRTESPGATLSPSRLAHQSGQPVQPPPSPENDPTPSRMAGVAMGGGELETMSSQENIDTSPVRVERQPLLLKDEETNFINKTVSLTSYGDDRSPYREKRANLLPLNTYVKLSEQPNDHDHEAECDRLNTDCKILNNALTVKSVTSQSSDVKNKHHVQDKERLHERMSHFITKDDELSCTNKEYQENNSDYKAKTEHIRHLTEPSTRDYCTQSKNSDLCEDSSIYDEEMGNLEHSSQLHIHNAYLVHPSSIICQSSESDVFKKEDTCGNIDQYLDIKSCLTIPDQIQDTSGSLDTSSDIVLIGGKYLDKESNLTSDVHPNDNPGSTPDEGTFQISECYRTKSSPVDTCGNELIHSDSMEIVSPTAMLENYNMHKELTNEFEQHVSQKGTSQKVAAKSYHSPLNRAEKHDQIWFNSDTLENKIHNENRSTHQSIWCAETAANETHNNKVISSFPEACRPANCQLEEQLPAQQLESLECNLEIQPNQLVPFNSKPEGSDWPSHEIEYKINNTATKSLAVTHQDANTFALVDHEKMQNDEPSLMESLCWNNSGSNTKNINREDTSNVTYIENKISCNAKDGTNNDHLQGVISDKDNAQICNHFSRATEIAMSPVSCPPPESEHFNFQSTIGQTSNSETVPNLKDHFMALKYNGEPKIVKSDGLQSSMLCLTEQNISPLTGKDQQRMIKIEANNAVNITEYVEYPDPKEQKSSLVCPPALGQSNSLQEIPRPVQNSLDHVIEIDMKDEHGRVQEVEDVQTIVTDSFKSSLIDGPNLNITQRFQPTLQHESHFGYLSMPIAEQIKTIDKIRDIDINARANFDDSTVIQGKFSHGEKNSENHKVTSAECDSEMGQSHITNKMRSTENFESTTLSIGSVMKAPSKTEQTENLKVRSATVSLNENTQKVEYSNDYKANLSERSKRFVTNMDKIKGIQSKEWQLGNYKEKETAAATEEHDKTVQHNDSFQLTAVNSVQSSRITQPTLGRIMNVDSNVLGDCRDCSKRPRGSNLNKGNNTAAVPDHPLKCIKMDIDTECKGKICKTFTKSRKSNQKFSNDFKIENLPLTYKNDKNQTEAPSAQTSLKLQSCKGQKKTIDPELAISLQTKTLAGKSIPSISPLNKQQTTAFRIKQPLSATRGKELISGAKENISFLKPSSEAARSTTETLNLAPSLNEQQKEEPVKRIRLSADNVEKCTLEKSKQACSSTEKDNPNKNFAMIKRMFEKTKEELTHKKEHKELKKAIHPQQDDRKVLNELLCSQAVEGQSLIKSVNPDDLHASPGSVAGEEIELLQPIIATELTNECNFDVKMCGSIATEESHFGEGLHRKAFRTKVIYGFVPLFDPGHKCVLKIHNAISHGAKTNSELIKQNYMLAAQECHVQTAARQYGNMFSAEGTLLEGFGETPEVIPIYLINRPANNIPYATVEEELIGEFVKYSVKDGRELNFSRKESEIGQKCCTFQHWVYQWTEGNLLVTDMQGVGMKLTDVGIATSRKGYKGFKGNCSISFIDQFKALHQCNTYCKMMGLKSLKVSQLKPKRNPSVKTQASQPIPRSTKKTPLSPQSIRRNFSSQAKSIFGDKTLQKHL